MKSSGVSRVESYTVEKHIKVDFAVLDVRTRRGLLGPPGMRTLGINQPR